MLRYSVIDEWTWFGDQCPPLIHDWDKEAVPVLTWTTWGWLRK